MMHDGMPYDPIQGQGHGASDFELQSLLPFTGELANDH